MRQIEREPKERVDACVSRDQCRLTAADQAADFQCLVTSGAKLMEWGKAKGPASGFVGISLSSNKR